MFTLDYVLGKMLRNYIWGDKMKLSDVISHIRENQKRLVAKAVHDMCFPPKVDENTPKKQEETEE